MPSPSPLQSSVNDSLPMSYAAQAGSGSQKISSSSQGQTLFSPPVKFESAVSQLSGAPHDKPSFADSLTPKAKATYITRQKQFSEKSLPSKVADISGDLLSEAFVKPAATMASFLQEKVTGRPSVKKQLSNQYESMEKRVQELNTSGKEKEATALFDDLMSLKIEDMTDEEILGMQTNHPVIQGMTKGLSVGTMQYIVLRNAPFLSQLANKMEIKAAAKLGLGAKISKSGRPIIQSVTAKTAFGGSLQKLAVELVGDIPSTFVMPVLNFDFENRPLTELPKDVARDLSLLVPATMMLHTTGFAVGQAFQASGAAKLASEAISSSAQGVIKATSKVIGILKALRIPITKDTRIAMERSLLDGEVNALSPILESIPFGDRSLLMNHFRAQRGNEMAERRMLSLTEKPKPVNIGENRRIRLSGPDPEYVPTEFDKSIDSKDVTPEEVKFFTSVTPDIRRDAKDTLVGSGVFQNKPATRFGRFQGKRLTEGNIKELETREEIDLMVGEIRQFREGIGEGRRNERGDIRVRQKQMEDMINERIPAEYKGRALALVRRASTKNGLVAASDSLEKLVRNITVAELRLGHERGTIKRSARARLKDLLTDPPQEVEFTQPYQRSLFFSNVLQIPFGKENVDLAEKALTNVSEKLYSSLTPLKGLPKTWAIVKQYPKRVSSYVQASTEEANDFFLRNFKNKQEVADFEKYAFLLQMRDRNKLGISNPGAARLNIPNNPDIEWIEQTLASIDSPNFQRISGELTEFFNTNSLQHHVEAGYMTQAVADELKKKFPNHIPFMYNKYMMETGGNPYNKGYNFTARDYFKPMKGGSGLDVNTNLYNTMVRASQRSINDRFTDEIATSLRKEMGVNPLKQYTTDSGRRRYQSLLDGELIDFDANDLEADQVPGLEGQRVMYSKYDNQAFIVSKQIASAVKGQEKTTPMLSLIARSTRAFQDLTTTYRLSFAVISNPLKDLAFSIYNTDSAVTSFMSEYLQSARDLLAVGLNGKSKGRKMFEIDEEASKSIMDGFMDARKWLANKVGTGDWEKWADEFVSSGASQGGFFAERTAFHDNNESVRNTIKEMILGDQVHTEYSLSSVDPKFINNTVIRNAVRLKNGLMALIPDNIAAAGQFMEMIPRMTEFRLQRKAGFGMISAGASASDITLDFREGGSSQYVRWYRALFPYYYTQFKGDIKMAKAMLKDRGQDRVKATVATGMRIMGASITPAVTSWFINKKLGIYDRTDRSLRENYWMIPTGTYYKDEYGQNQPIVITPRMGEFEQKMTPIIFGILDKWYADDPAAFQNITVENFLKNYSLSGMHPGLRLGFEIPANYSLYRDEPIEPSSMESIPENLRKYAGTTSAGSLFGKTLGISPIKGDYVFSSVAPALFDYYKMFSKNKENMPIEIVIAESLKIIQTPGVYFEDLDLEKKRKEIQMMLKKVNRTKNVTADEQKAETERLWKEMAELDKMISVRWKERRKHPLQGTDISTK